MLCRRGRLPVARRRHRAGDRVRRAPAAGGVGGARARRAGAERGPPAVRPAGAAVARARREQTPGRCSRRSSRARSTRRVRDRIIAETRGNPLALLELPRGMSAAELAGGFAVPASLGSPAGLEDGFRRRLDALPPDTLRLVQLAAADPVGDPLLVWRAAELLGIRPEAATPAVEADLLEIRAQVRFHHPLVRSAAYRSASHAERRALHAALAEATDVGARSRPARVAPRPGGGRPRRGGRRRARALCRPGAGARRHRRVRRLPRERGDAHARPGRARAPAARGRACQARRGRARGGPAPADRGRGGADRRRYRRRRPSTCAATSRSTSAASAMPRGCSAARPGVWSRSIPSSRARRTSRRSARRSGPVTWTARVRCSRRPRPPAPRRPRPTRPARWTSCSTRSRSG